MQVHRDQSFNLSDLYDSEIYFYSAFGLKICSQLEFPELAPCVGGNDVNIRFGVVPQEASARDNSLYVAAPGKYLLDIPHVARYLVRAGTEIIIETAPLAQLDTVRLFLLGSCLGALLHQRLALPIHASSIVTRRGAVVFAGKSGCGKSTLAAAFRQRGLGVLADDVSVIDLSATVGVWPGSACVMLWADALSQLNLAVRDLHRVRPGIEKYFLPIQRSLPAEPVRLHAFYMMEKVNSARLTISPLVGLAKLEALTRNTFRKNLIDPMGLAASHFSQIGRLASSVPMRRVVGPKEGLIDELVERLLEDFA